MAELTLENVKTRDISNASTKDDLDSIASDAFDHDDDDSEDSWEALPTETSPAPALRKSEITSIEEDLAKAYACSRPADSVQLDQDGFILFEDEEEEDQATKAYLNAFEQELKASYAEREMVSRPVIDEELLSLASKSGNKPTSVVTPKAPAAPKSVRPGFVRRHNAVSEAAPAVSQPPATGLAGAAGRALRRGR